VSAGKSGLITDAHLPAPTSAQNGRSAVGPPRHERFKSAQRFSLPFSANCWGYGV